MDTRKKMELEFPSIVVLRQIKIKKNFSSSQMSGKKLTWVSAIELEKKNSEFS